MQAPTVLLPACPSSGISAVRSIGLGFAHYLSSGFPTGSILHGKPAGNGSCASLALSILLSIRPSPYREGVLGAADCFWLPHPHRSVLRSAVVTRSVHVLPVNSMVYRYGTGSKLLLPVACMDSCNALRRLQPCLVVLARLLHLGKYIQVSSSFLECQLGLDDDHRRS